MNSTQIQTAVAPIVAALASYLATRYPLLDQDTWNLLVGALAISAVSLYTGYITKKQSLANTLGSYKDTTVVTDASTANALPKNDSVVSNTEVKVVKQ